MPCAGERASERAREREREREREEGTERESTIVTESLDCGMRHVFHTFASCTDVLVGVATLSDTGAMVFRCFCRNTRGDTHLGRF